VKYRTIVADPPWAYPEGFAGIRGPCTKEEVRSGWRDRVAMVRPPLQYSSLSLEQIAALNVGDMAYRDCRLFLWTTQRYLQDAFPILNAWGFTYRQTLIWHKVSSFSPFGGSIAPNNIEFLLVGKRGNPPVLDRMKGCVVATPGNSGRRKDNGTGPNKHSAKPEAFLDLVEQVSPGPYLELFARRQRLGWDTWGNEAINHVDLGGAA